MFWVVEVIVVEKVLYEGFLGDVSVDVGYDDPDYLMVIFVM